MSITPLANVAELASNQSFGNGSDTTAATQPIQTQVAATSALPADTFTPSSQNESAQSTAQDAGLFQVSQLALSVVTAGILSNQTSPPQPTQSGAPTQLAQTSANSSVSPESATVTSANIQTPAPASLPTPTVAVGTLGEPEALNATLLGLGLSNSDVQYIDHVASSAGNYNPAVYGDLVQQFQVEVAQQSADAAAENTTATQGNTISPAEK